MKRFVMMNGVQYVGYKGNIFVRKQNYFKFTREMHAVKLQFSLVRTTGAQGELNLSESGNCADIVSALCAN